MFDLLCYTGCVLFYNWAIGCSGEIESDCQTSKFTSVSCFVHPAPQILNSTFIPATVALGPSLNDCMTERMMRRESDWRTACLTLAGRCLQCVPKADSRGARLHFAVCARNQGDHKASCPYQTSIQQGRQPCSRLRMASPARDQPDLRVRRHLEHQLIGQKVAEPFFLM